MVGMTQNQPRNRDLARPGHPTQFTSKVNSAPNVSLAEAGPTCTEGCGQPAEYRCANVPRGYRAPGEAAFCATHAAERAADGDSIEQLPKPQKPGEVLVWLVEGDDHEYELVEAATAQEAVGIASDLFSGRYDEDYDVDLLVIAGAFRGEVDDTDSLTFVPVEGVTENAAYQLLENAV